jgi:hypothetical protein
VKVSTVDLIVPLRKTERQGIFTGIVLEPNLEDAHGDVFSAPEIERTCHDFMREYAMSKAEHSPDVGHVGRDPEADLLENFIAPQDMLIGGEHVSKGSWVQSWLVNCPLTKQEIEEGELTGLSLEGTGFRRPITREVQYA